MNTDMIYDLFEPELRAIETKMQMMDPKYDKMMRKRFPDLWAAMAELCARYREEKHGLRARIIRIGRKGPKFDPKPTSSSHDAHLKQRAMR